MVTQRRKYKGKAAIADDAANQLYKCIEHLTRADTLVMNAAGRAGEKEKADLADVRRGMRHLSWRLRRLLQPDFEMPAELTCDTCRRMVECRFAMDAYNTNGDCLADK